MTVTQDQIEQFNEEGFLIIEDLLTPSEVAKMRAGAEEIARPGPDQQSLVRRQVEPAISRGDMVAGDYELSLRKMTSIALSRDDVFVAHALRPSIVEVVKS